MDEWIKGTITVENGVVVAVQSETPGQSSASLGGGALYTVLTEIQKHGWKIEGELPPYSIEGRYVINLKKPKTRVEGAAVLPGTKPPASSCFDQKKAPATEVEWESIPLGEWPGFSVCFAAASAGKDVTDVVGLETVRGEMLTLVFLIRRSQRRCEVGHDHEIGRIPGEAHPFVHPSNIKVGKSTGLRNQKKDGIERRRCDGSFPRS